MCIKRVAYGLMGMLCTSLVYAVDHDVSALIRINAIATDAHKSFLNKGDDVTRWDKDKLTLSQALFEVKTDWTSSLSSNITLFSYVDGNVKTGFTEAYLDYRPLLASPKKWRVRMGLFYPELSVENDDIGWLSNDTYSFSAINAWYAEELRVPGFELSLSQNGRRVRSPWSWDLRVATYKGNDTLGTLLTWRGFAIHDRQTPLNDRVEFASYPEVINPATIKSPDDVAPFKEIDGRFGFYLGAHLTYLRQLEFKYYFYDNKADPNALTPERYYAWHTIFHNLSLQYQLSESTNIKAQLLDGNTLMGMNVVKADYHAAFAMVTHKWTTSQKSSVRIETFDVDENDVLPQDNNHSNGIAATVNYQHALSKGWKVGIEYNWVKNYAYNRPTLSPDYILTSSSGYRPSYGWLFSSNVKGFEPKAIVRQWQVVLEWRY